MASVEDRVKQPLLDHLNLNEKRYSASMSLVEDFGADSLDQVELVMAFEEEFGIEIPDGACKNLVTVADCIRYVETKR